MQAGNAAGKAGIYVTSGENMGEQRCQMAGGYRRFDRGMLY